MIKRRTLLALATVGLSACGFELRRAPELSFKTLQLAGFKPHSPLADELRRSIAASTTTRVVEAVSQAEVVLEALADSRDKGVVASTTAGQVREVQLRAVLNFRVRTPAGKELIAPTEIALSRDMTYNERDALAKEQEEEALYRAMQSDIAGQVLRRLAAVKTL
jgi:LPS-assembly lipoprotein